MPRPDACDLEPFAEDLSYAGDPFIWNDNHRFQLRCELVAACFHLYGISAADADYIMETFPFVKCKDMEAHGSYRTKETILKLCDDFGKPESERAKVDMTRMSMIVVLLLQGAKAASRPTSRDDLTLGLVLFFNDAARKAVLSQSLSDPSVRAFANREDF